MKLAICMRHLIGTTYWPVLWVCQEPYMTILQHLGHKASLDSTWCIWHCLGRSGELIMIPMLEQVLV